MRCRYCHRVIKKHEDSDGSYFFYQVEPIDYRLPYCEHYPGSFKDYSKSCDVKIVVKL